jgi:hypothetical protein
MAKSKLNPVRVHAGAVPATDAPGHWLPSMMAVDVLQWKAVIPKMCAHRATALAVAERHIERECRTWRQRHDGWRVAPAVDTLLPDYPRSRWTPDGGWWDSATA